MNSKVSMFSVLLSLARKCIQKNKSCPVSPHSWSSGSHELRFLVLEVQVRKSQKKRLRNTFTFDVAPNGGFGLCFTPVVFDVSNLPQDHGPPLPGGDPPLRCHLD